MRYKELADPPPKKRGRPPVFDDDTFRFAKRMSQLTRTRRGTVNQIYGYEGMNIIRDMTGIEYIIDKESQIVKFCILTELGRLNDEQAAREAATFICGQEAAGDHRTAHEWAAIVRHWRLTRHDKQE